MGKARDLANLLTNGLVAPTKLSAGAPTWNAASSVGIKATPNASWASDYAVLQMNSTGSINGNAVAIVMANNTYYDGTNARYLTTGPASDYFQYNGSHTWRYAASGTAGAVATMVLGMTQDPSGNLLVGTATTTKNARLNQRIVSVTTGSVFGGASLTTYAGTNTGTRNLFDMNRSRGTTEGSMTAVAANDFLGSMLFRGSDGTDFLDSSMVSGEVDGTVSTGNMPGRLSFHTAGATGGVTERARIDSSGNFMVGTTSASGAKLTVSAGNNLGLRVDTSTANESVIITGTSSNLQVKHPAAGVELLNSGGNAFRIVALSNGVSLAASGTSWGAISDERLKDIIEPITNASAKVASLRAIIGKYKTDEEGVRRSFLIAQDVKAVFPEAVVKASEDDDTLLLQYTDTIPLLVAAIQEQQAFIQSLQADVADLKAAA